MDWQNDNHQNELFYGKSHLCPACHVQEEGHMHFISCKDPVLSRLNSTSVNKFIQTVKKSCTAGLISTIFKDIISAIRHERDPLPPQWKHDELGVLGAQAWDEQRLIGWHHMLKGRLSITWGTMQQWFYRNHPDYRQKKTLTGQGWMVKMVKAFTTMDLKM